MHFQLHYLLNEKKCLILFCFIFFCLEDVCSLPPESGMCTAAFLRYYYDIQSGQCKPFTWGGCGTNGNNFETEQECYISCSGTHYLCLSILLSADLEERKYFSPLPPSQCTLLTWWYVNVVCNIYCHCII